jgi:hypothetical protein
MVIQTERAGSKLKSLTKDEARNSTIHIMKEIKNVSGCILNDVDKLDAQASTIQFFLVTGYGEFTAKEIIHAFFLNAQGKFEEVYRHYNRELNCEFIGDVLNAYKRFKLLIVQKCQELSNKALLQPPAVNKTYSPIDYDFWKEQIQYEYEKKYLSGKKMFMTGWQDKKLLTLIVNLPYRWSKKEMYHHYAQIVINQSNYKGNTIATFKAAYQMVEKNISAYMELLAATQNTIYHRILHEFNIAGVKNIWQTEH